MILEALMIMVGILNLADTDFNFRALGLKGAMIQASSVVSGATEL
jgi:hypothetical protein